MTAGELCIREVLIARADETVRTAAQRMRDSHIGDLVIVETCDGRTVPVGMVTDRDLVISVLAEGQDPETARLGALMTSDLVTVSEETEVASVLAAMMESGIRRMPVVNRSGELEGILTYDDFLEWMAEQMSALVTLVELEHRHEHERSS